MQTVIYIYGLVDPRDKRVRYIGKTNSLKRRLEQHVSNDDASNPRKQRWIAGLKEKGLRPEMIVVEECDNANWIEREKFWIAEYRVTESDLINIADGGEGHTNESWRISCIRSFAKAHKLQIKKCFVCGGITVSSIDICSKCLREIDENYQNSDWYKFLADDHRTTHDRERRREKRISVFDV